MNSKPAGEPPNATRQATGLGGKIALRFCVFLCCYGLLVFLPAGTWHFWRAWAFLAVSFLPAVLFFLVLAATDPETVRRRLENKEPVDLQRNLIRYFQVVFVAVLALPGLDHRFGWTARLAGPIPGWLSLIADGFALAGMMLAFWTVQVNRFAARTIRVEAGQEVISTGPYRWVRHPMYSGSILFVLAMPIALGSLVASPFFALLIPFYVVRLLNEEKLLVKDLAGYSDFCQRTRYRLVPFVW